MVFNLYEGFKRNSSDVGIMKELQKSQLSHARRILQQQVITTKV
jgi:hypothetical protein